MQDYKHSLLFTLAANLDAEVRGLIVLIFICGGGGGDDVLGSDERDDIIAWFVDCSMIALM